MDVKVNVEKQDRGRIMGRTSRLQLLVKMPLSVDISDRGWGN